MKKIFLVFTFICASLIMTACDSSPTTKQKIAGTNETADADASGKSQVVANIPPNWKSYHCAESGLSFKYPPEWDLKEYKAQAYPYPYQGIVFKDPEQPEAVELGPKPGPAEYFINIYTDDAKGRTAASYYEENYCSFSTDESQKAACLKKASSINIMPGLTALTFEEGAAPASGPMTMIVFVKGNKLYRANYGAMTTPTTHKKLYQDFLTMLASFEFEN